MENFNISLCQKKGQKGINSKISYLVGAVIVIVLATAVAPTMFENVSNLTGVTGVPAWVPTVLLVIVGAGLVFLIWRAFGGN